MATAEECAREILAVVPRIMQGIRVEVRRGRAGGLSVPQFRTLIFLHHHEGASLSQAAEHVGLSRPSMSKMIDGLVRSRHVDRRTAPGDRRRVRLGLTRRGRDLLSAAFRRAQQRIARGLEGVSPADRAAVLAGLRILEGAFAPPGGDRS